MSTPTKSWIAVLSLFAALTSPAWGGERAPLRSCGTPEPALRAERFGIFEKVPSDCSQTSTNPLPVYAPAVVWEIPVVVHVIANTAGTQGVVSDALIASQIEILNEDFQALLGTPGAAGTDVRLRFVLATLDPDGDPTTGITRSFNTTWFQDGGSYWSSLAWDPQRYLNLYTNDAGGDLGYVPFLPADAGGTLAGTAADRVVVLWSAFGRNAPIGPPFDQGRTATHEIGHYLGLEHTFNGGCASGTSPACYGNGDLICDTNPEQIPTFGCPVGAVSCGSPDPIENYMDYSDDTCMERFTTEQARRIRCTLMSYRPLVYRVVTEIFEDGFESGDVSAWSSAVP